MALNIDLAALKDAKTTLPGLAMICVTILLISGTVTMADLQNLPWKYILGFLFGGGGIALLGANSNKAPADSPEAPPVETIAKEVIGAVVEPPAG